ncbi:MAG: glycosyltransferase [Oscillospiraceae bacterium]|nr:glycosyltransferase [Oscillospiraceae bacterium]
MPKLSIIIPVYNAEQYLPQTLDSILGQSLKEIEVICVDDGSTDRSLELLRNYAARDSRVKVLCQQNLHAGVARNAGLAVATGEYVHFMDADDYVLDYAYEAIYNKAIKYELDLLKFCSVPYDMSQDCFVDLPAYTLSKLSPGDFNRLLTLDEGSPIYKVNVAPWNGVYRRAFLEERKIRFNNLFCVNDRSFFDRVVTNAKRMMIARDRLVVHRVSLATSLVGVRAKNFDCHFKSIQIVSDQLEQDGIAPEVAQRIMTKEFRDLYVWFRKFYADEQVGEEIRRETERFVHNYSGLFAHILRAMYRTALQRSAEYEEKELPRPLTIYHEPCKNPKVTVVVPTFNVEDYLNEALYSLTVQTLKEIEFIVVNDGSTDHSLTIIKEYAHLDKRFRILDGPNGGYGKAMNRGIDAARGKYLGILEPDDFVPSDMFQSLYRIAIKNDLDLIKADFWRFTVNDDGTLKKKTYRLTSNKSYYNRLINTSEDINTFKFVMNTWSGIYKLDFLNRWNIRHNETPGASYQDNGFWFQTFCRAQRAWFLDQPYYMNRRDNPNSSMFNRKKLYCVTDEYRYLWNWMSREPQLLEKFTPIFYAKKFSNFMVTYRRLAPEYQLEYLRHIRDEFKQPLEEGLLDEELMEPIYWKMVQEMVADPEAYHEKIRVSVIMPVYNAERYLHQTLNSLLIRNEVQFEMICVDDGSTDRSLEILREYEAKDSRVRVFTQANAGAGAARNYGMQFARGEYLSFLDADDFFDSDMLRRAYDEAHTKGTEITAFRCDQYIESTGQFQSMGYTVNMDLLPARKIFAGQDIPQNIFKAFVGWAWDKLFLADFVRENGLRFQEQRTTNDMLFVFSALVKAQRISVLDRVMAHHRRDSGSLSVTREKSWHCFYDALVALREQLKQWNLYQRFERDFINYSLHFSLWNVTTLRGASYYKLYDKLTSQWLKELGVLDREESYFYNQEEYRILQTMLSSSPEDFLFYLLDESKEQGAALRNRMAGMNDSILYLRGRRDRLEAKLETFRQRDRDRRETISQQKAEIRRLKAALKEEKKQLKRVKSSTIWKVGRIVTWLPRKLKKLFTKR